MHIKKKLSQHRRDFQAIYQCEHCNHEYEDYGYDDLYFHQEVIPNKKCRSCGLTATAQTSAPSIPAHVVI